jgi:SEC-C motif-containing protein
MTTTCPCTSGKNYADCCGPVIAGTRKAATAAELMRSRYSAYALGEVDWLVQSQHPDGRTHVDRRATEEWSKRSTWHRLEILQTTDGGAEDQEGFVEFKAYYTLGGEDITHHEVASFHRIDGDWYFMDGVEVKPRPFRNTEHKPGPNEPCRCGSGKKFKKCCGRPGVTA